MSGITTLKSDVSLDVLRANWRFALARIKSDPNAAAYVADFTAFGPTWVAVDQKELAYEDAVAAADATVVAADEAIDALVDKVSVAIFAGKKVAASPALAQLYFGSQTPSKFKRPVLGTELQNVQGWPALLAAAPQPALQALAVPVTAAVNAGNAAAKAFSDALVARDGFRLGGGDRQKAFDAFNSLCARAYGGLKAFAHDHPDLDLPSTYAESFFKGSAGVTHGKTVAQTAAAAASAQAKAAKAQAKHDAALKAAAAKEAALKDKQTKVAAAKAAAAAAKTAAAAARAAKAAAAKKKV